MRAVILAAGMGTRLRPLTNHKPKCLVEFRGRSLIDYTLHAFECCGVSDVSVVRGYCGAALDKYRVRFFENPDFETTNMVHSLFCAAELFEGDTDLIVSYGDIAYSPEVLSRLVHAKGDISVVVDRLWAQLWRQRMPNPLEDAETLKIDENGNIRELGRRATHYDQIEGQYIGLFKIAGGALAAVRAFYEGLDPEGLYEGRTKGQMFMTTFIQLVIDRLFAVRPVWTDGQWLEVDAVADLALDPINWNAAEALASPISSEL